MDMGDFIGLAKEEAISKRRFSLDATIHPDTALSLGLDEYEREMVDIIMTLTAMVYADPSSTKMTLEFVKSWLSVHPLQDRVGMNPQGMVNEGLNEWDDIPYECSVSVLVAKSTNVPVGEVEFD